MVFIGHTFPAKRSSAMRTASHGLAQGMEKAARVAKAGKGSLRRGRHQDGLRTPCGCWRSEVLGRWPFTSSGCLLLRETCACRNDGSVNGVEHLSSTPDSGHNRQVHNGAGGVKAAKCRWSKGHLQPDPKNP